MVSDFRVRFWTGLPHQLPPGSERLMTVTDQVLDVVIADGVGDQMPQATISLPLKRSTDEFGRVPYSQLLAPGDLCTIEVLASYGHAEGWTTVLDGIVRSVSEREQLTGSGAQVGTTIEVGSFADVMAEDTVAWWMFYGQLEGWSKVWSWLAVDQMTKSPYKVAFEFLRRVAMTVSQYDNLGATLDQRMSLAFNGLDANTTIALSLVMAEGPYWEIISRYLDAPLHELYVTTMPASDMPTGGKQYAASPPADRAGEDGGVTTGIWRAAPYVFADASGKADASEWRALPMHTLDDDFPLVTQRSGSYSKAGIRNFVLAYPAYQFVEEHFMYAAGAVIANLDSIRAFGYRPLKLRTHLIVNGGEKPEGIDESTRKLGYRVAGQWNNLHLLKTGLLNAPLMPWIRPGQRVRAPDPWVGDEVFEYHVRARQMTLSPVDGARMTLNLERGAPARLYDDNAWLDTLVGGLEPVLPRAEELAAEYRQQDEPGEALV
jgi:hypothetical protein